MERTVEQMLCDLYALRAGLSVISEKKDEMDAVLKRKYNMCNALGKSFVDGREIYTLRDCYDAKYVSLGIDRPTEDVYRIIREARSDFAAAIKYSWICYSDKYLNNEKWFADYGKKDDISKEAAPEIYVRWVASGSGEDFFKAQLKNETQYPVRGLFHKKEKDAQAHRIAVYRKIIADLPSVKKKYADVEKRFLSEAMPIKQVFDALYDELVENYSKLIDPRDWKYLDLVIFYFETGRAETMKEALLLVEREVQTQRIVSAIETAAERICRSINSAAQMINAQLVTISSQLNTVIQNQQAQIAQSNKLLEAADMSNALINKANVTSERLLQDVTYIQNYKL